MIETLAVGVDLGATKIASALVTSRGEVLAERKVLTLPEEGERAVLDRMAVEINALVKKSKAALVGIGIGSPGLVDPQRGTVAKAVNLGWDEVKIVDEIQRRLYMPIPVWVEKDSNASALGECYFGAAKEIRDLVYIGVGSGLGAGLVANGELIRGASFIAADVGHLSLDPEGLECLCGLRGCAETIISGHGLTNLTQRLLDSEPYSQRPDHLRDLTPASIVSAAREGDPISRRAVLQLSSALGVVLSAMVVLLNPAMIVIGGGLGKSAFDLLVDGIWTEIGRRANKISWERLKIVPSRLSTSATGAASLVFRANPSPDESWR